MMETRIQTKIWSIQVWTMLNEYPIDIIYFYYKEKQVFVRGSTWQDMKINSILILPNIVLPVYFCDLIWATKYFFHLFSSSDDKSIFNGKFSFVRWNILTNEKNFIIYPFRKSFRFIYIKYFKTRDLFYML